MSDTFEKVREGIYKCTTCGEEVESGIINISGHWSKCTGKEFSEALDKLAAQKKAANIKLSENDIEILREKHLKKK